MNAVAGIMRDRHGRVQRPIAIRGLIEWAFQRECASIDFDEVRTVSGGHRPGVGTEYLLMQRHNLGCQVDGGGRSEPHPDADLVASALAALPDAQGGRRMGVWIAELARAGMVPDWRRDAAASCRPLEWRQTKHGRFAKTRSIGVHCHVVRGRRVEVDVRVCPVGYSNTAQEIARARRLYLEWWGALLEVRRVFQVYGGLTSWYVTDEMPKMKPWQKTS